MSNDNSYDFSKDIEDLHTALEGDKSTIPKIVEIICGRTNAQRQILKENYKSTYGVDLTQKLEDKLSGDLKSLIIGLMLTPTDYDVEEVFKAIDGAGTDDDALIEIIGTRSNSQLINIGQRYPELKNETLEKAIEEDTSKKYQALLIALVQGKRRENPYPNINKMNEIVKELSPDKEGKINKDNYVKHFSNCSYSEICTFCNLYEKQYGPILGEIEKEFGADSYNLYKTILNYVSDSGRYFAERINKFSYEILIRVMISRSEIDMDEIRDSYRELYHKELVDDIAENTKGDFQNALIILAKK